MGVPCKYIHAWVGTDRLYLALSMDSPKAVGS